MEDYKIWADETIKKIRHKMAWVSEKNKDKIPCTTDREGNYDDRSDQSRNWRIDDGINCWTNGFWGGMMWLMYQDTGEERYAGIARRLEEKLDRCFDAYYGLHHDAGFMFVPTAVTDFRLTGNDTARKRAMHAANLLAGRFNPVGNYIRAWNDLEQDTRGWAIIDCMFNLSLLYWASEESADPRFRQVAVRHADTVMKYFVRPDGSVKHIVEFDPETGEYIKSYAGQGCKDGSAWSRGQGWAVYGFMISYIHTGRQEYLETAKKVAHYCMENIPESGIVPVDFRQPRTPDWEDSCAACVIAGGLLEIAGCVQKQEQAKYRDEAVKLLKAIDTSRACWGEECDAIVQNCSASYHDEKHHITMCYADYYFMEAVYKLAGMGRLIW